MTREELRAQLNALSKGWQFEQIGKSWLPDEEKHQWNNSWPEQLHGALWALLTGEPNFPYWCPHIQFDPAYPQDGLRLTLGTQVLTHLEKDLTWKMCPVCTVWRPGWVLTTSTDEAGA